MLQAILQPSANFDFSRLLRPVQLKKADPGVIAGSTDPSVSRNDGSIGAKIPTKVGRLSKLRDRLRDSLKWIFVRAFAAGCHQFSAIGIMPEEGGPGNQITKGVYFDDRVLPQAGEKKEVDAEIEAAGKYPRNLAA